MQIRRKLAFPFEVQFVLTIPSHYTNLFTHFGFGCLNSTPTFRTKIFQPFTNDQSMIEIIFNKSWSFNDRKRNLILSLIWRLLRQRNKLAYFVHSKSTICLWPSLTIHWRTNKQTSNSFPSFSSFGLSNNFRNKSLFLPTGYKKKRSVVRIVVLNV